MLASSRYALKEWAVVCAALAAGRQTVLLRKGGIAEGQDGFSVQHPEFWLFPTRFHQSADELQSRAFDLLNAVSNAAPPEGAVRLALYAVVESVHRVDDAAALASITSEHILSPQTVDHRFRYRHPGLFFLILRAYVLPQPQEIVDEPRFAGCHSWVELTSDLPTERLEPVLSDEEFANRAERLRSLLI